MIRINEIALSLDEDESQLKKKAAKILKINEKYICLLYTSPSPRDRG